MSVFKQMNSLFNFIFCVSPFDSFLMKNALIVKERDEYYVKFRFDNFDVVRIDIGQFCTNKDDIRHITTTYSYKTINMMYLNVSYFYFAVDSHTEVCLSEIRITEVGLGKCTSKEL